MHLIYYINFCFTIWHIFICDLFLINGQLAPQRWQDTPSKAVQVHNVVIAFEERIYDAVIEDLQTREPTEDFKAMHVICLDTKVSNEKKVFPYLHQSAYLIFSQHYECWKKQQNAHPVLG